MKVKLGKSVTLKKLDAGSLFLFNGTIALKTEYTSDGQCDAYIVGSGEYFWGGVKSKEERETLVVHKLQLK